MVLGKTVVDIHWHLLNMEIITIADDYIERGCLQDFSAGELQSCLAADPKNCTACYGESCNTQNANSTSKLQVSFNIFLTIVAILIFKQNFDIIV